MSPKIGCTLKLRRVERFAPRRVERFTPRRVVLVNISPKKKVNHVKPSSNFQELAVGMVIPSISGSYEIISELAIGRCCEVYVGENASTKLQEAVKVFIRQQHYRGALLRELKFLTKLSPNPHIVLLKEALQHEGRDILIHELLSGTLRDAQLMHDGRPASPWFVATLATHLMRGLAHMHALGVVHGDLKPHNVMWSAHSETFKIIDFGVSFGAAEDMEHAVQSRAYQAPEAVEWNEWLQRRRLGEGGEPPEEPPPPRPGSPIDVWSVGCMVAEVLTRGKVFPCGWSGHDPDEALTEALTLAEGHQSQEFLAGASQWLHRCLSVEARTRLRAEEGARAAFLTAPQTPSLMDLVALPTTVLRVMNLVRPGMDPAIALDLVEGVVSRAASATHHVLSRATGSLFLQFSRAQDCEVAFRALRHASVGGFSLLPSFFPAARFDQRAFF